MKPPAFQFYADDFIGGTCDLSALDVGAYIRLLCYQWSRGSIPVEDSARLERIAGTPVSEYVLAKFPSGKNKRMESVRKKQDEYRAQQSLKGKASAKARFNRGSTVVQPKHQPKSNSPSPTPSPSPNINPPRPAAPDGAVIEQIYQTYPRKVGKHGALRAITNLLKRNPPQFAGELLAKVQAYAEAVRTWPAGEERFIPHPATWFNDARYDDDPETWKRKSAPQKTAERSQYEQDDYSKYTHRPAV